MPSEVALGRAWWRGHDPPSLAYYASNFPCRAACPVGTNAGGYVSLIAQGRYDAAYALARGPNPFASVCGRVCAHPCEAACRRGMIDAPIHIRALKRVVNERQGIESGRSFEEIAKVVERPRPPTDRGGKVAIVGAGPAGLACAHDLALMGHRVTVFDAASVPGGMMRLGIPEYRLPRAQLDREIDFVRWLGVDIRLGTPIGEAVTFEALTRDFDAVFLAPGCRRGRPLKVPGSELEGVLTAIDLLVSVNLGVPIDVGERVIVVGGGNVAYDAARSARRFGGTSTPEEAAHNLAIDAAVVASSVMGRTVTMVALESREEMPADPSEIAEGTEEGVRLLNRRGTKEIVGEGGRVVALRTLDVARVFDDAGRFAPELVPGSEKEIPCDTVIVAVGQMADLSFLGASHGLRTTPQNLIAVDPQTLATSRPGVFAGGDIAFGPRIVISAVADGRRAAKSIDTHLTGRADEPPRHRLRVFSTFGYDHPFARGDYETRPAADVPLVPVERRTPAGEVEQALDDLEARAEGSRCLHCWINTVFDSSGMNGTECIQCGGCVDVCPVQCIDLVSLRRLSSTPGDQTLRLPDGSPFPRAGSPGAALLKDETACIRCGLCARRCPAGLITMQALYREDEAPLCRLADSEL
jgi:NADPH-dependent glutamate synthase beta subunit-like oxidoreductase/NAD-dependent dihydropyrimidine dehydrogenase PreA subunit